jgi:hypothetical protein
MPPFTLAGVSGPNVNPSSACEEAILKLNNMGILQNGGVAMRFVGAGRYVWAVLTLARRNHCVALQPAIGAGGQLLNDARLRGKKSLD